jgi:outer membrane protein insertion porin family
LRLGRVLYAALFGIVLMVISPTPTWAGESAGFFQQSVSDDKTAAQPSFSTISGYEGLTVRDIRFPALRNTDWASLLELIAQKIGQPFDREHIRESIQALSATGRFADISIATERTPDGGVSLTFVTSPNYFIGQVRAEGAPNPPASNQIVNASKLQLGELFTREKLERALQNIGRLMDQNGFYSSKVEVEKQTHPDTKQIDILFRMTAGPQAHVGKISITGEPGYSQGQIEDIARLHPGDFVSVQRVSRALELLRKRYAKQDRLLSQVAIADRAYRPEANVVDYSLEVEPGPRVDIVAEGFKIRRSVLKRSVPVYEENAVDDDLLNEGRRNLLNYLQDRGYFEAKVTIKKTSGPSGELRVIYIIDSGPVHKLVKVEIKGNSFPEELLRSRMQVQPAGRLFSHGRYSQGLLNEDIRNLEENPYRYNGFDQVEIKPLVQDDYQGVKNHLAVTLEINEGPQTLVGKMQLAGNDTALNDPFPTINISTDQPFSQARVAEDREIILNYYVNHGFAHVTFEATAAPASDTPNRMDVTYAIHPGTQVFVNQVIVSGTNYTKPFVVSREIQVKPGEPLSQIGMLDSQRRLYDLGIFSQVDTAIQNPEGEETRKNALVDVQEAKRYTFNYGFGFEFQTGQPALRRSSSQTQPCQPSQTQPCPSSPTQPLGETGVSPRISFGVTRLNFRGRNHTITFKSNVGRLQQRGLLSYDAPRWFNSPKWRLTFTAFYDNTLDVTTFTSQRLEGSVQAEQTIDKGSVMDYRFTYRRVQARDLQISPNQIPLLSQPTRVGMPGFSYIRNRRDNDLESTKGSYTTVDGGVADSHFASETDFSRILIQNSTYYSFGKHRPAGKKLVFARSTRIGLETPFGNTFMPQPGGNCSTSPSSNTICLPLAERFFSGGGNSHRGFGLNQAGPRDPTTGFPLGGTALFLNNLELRLPPPTLPFFQENLSFAIFHDAGNVFTNGHDLTRSLSRWQQRISQPCQQPRSLLPSNSSPPQCDFNYIAQAIGIGVRYKTPIGPVRFDFGYNPNPPRFRLTETDSSNPPQDFSVPRQAGHFNVFFSIGQTF